MLFALLLMGLTPETAEAVARAAALEAAQDHRFDVVSELDIKEMADFEAEKQACGSSESCVSQLAGAYDARLVLFLSLYAVGEERHAQLTLRDLRDDHVLQRLDATGLDDPTLFASVRQKTKEALATFVAADPTKPTRLFVSRSAVQGQLQEEAAAPSPLLIGAAVGAAAGAAVVVAGVLLGVAGDNTLQQADVLRDKKDAALAQRTGGYVGAGVGGVVLVAGAITGVVALLGDAP